jgi:hypothetical protein
MLNSAALSATSWLGTSTRTTASLPPGCGGPHRTVQHGIAVSIFQAADSNFCEAGRFFG